ncbi:uncharacterized protein LOC121332960 [Onychostruthus taczanowskii]|uniref:uncharacterized protein LOC121332960 n=1 Tax=Onychostruthus taczanowskii TaxID=356909 RepID=UPI001B807BB3|nr:uncharacterized protein LOC121332960 [Onychostruthus taczanowskii]
MVRAFRSHWCRTRKSLWCLRGGAAPASPFRRGDGGGGATAAVGAGTGAGAGAGAGAGRWWEGDVTIPVGTVLLAGPVALYPLRSGAFPVHLLAALRARPRAIATKGILTYFAPYEHRRWKRRTICAG